MNPPTLSTLPEDVLDEIFCFLDEEWPLHCEFASSLTHRLLTVVNPPDRNAFPSLALTSRSLLPIARRYLYSTPLHGISPNWPTALQLLTSLKANGNGLGRLVKALPSLTWWVHKLTAKESGVDLPFKQSGFSEAYSWFLAMLEACPQLKQVDIVFYNRQELKKVADGLSKSVSTLDKVKIEEISVSELKVALIERFTKKLAPLNLEEFEVVSFAPVDGRSSAAPPSLPLHVKNLSLQLSQMPFEHNLHLLPAHSSSLRSLTIIGGKPSSLALFNLGKLTGATLTTLSIQAPQSRWDDGISYSNYASDQGVPVVPLEFFSFLPKIEHLLFSEIRAVSIKRVTALVQNSPNLIELVAVKSTCAPDDGVNVNIPQDGWQRRIFPPQQMVELFKQFEHVETLNLGTIPFDSVAAYDAVCNTLSVEGREFFCWPRYQV
jgi:hypothetical protein